MTSPTTDRRLGLAGNTAFKAPVTVLAAGNITQSGEQTIDGVAVLASNSAGVPDRVLCTGMTDATKNGIWDVSTAAWTRSVDANGNYDLVQGTSVLVNRGTTYGGSYWKISTSGTLTIGSTLIAWARALANSLSTLTFTAAGTGAEDRDAQSKMRDFVSVLDYIPVAQHAAIAAGTSTYDCYASIMEAINSVTYLGTFLGSANRAGPDIYFPPGVYCCNTTIELKKRVTLFGQGSGQAYGDASILKFPADITGVIVHTATSGGTTTAGSASLLRGLSLYSVGGSDVTKHGIWLRARATVENCYIENFPGNGYNIVASAGSGGLTEGNANCWRVTGGRINDCGGHGFFVDGADANAGMAENIDSSSNGGWGIYDSSFLGNTYVGCHTSSNVLGAYKADSLNGCNVLLGCYSESGQPASDLISPTLVLGGLQAADFTAGSNATILQGNSFTTPLRVNNAAGAVTVYSLLGIVDATQTVLAFGSSDDTNTNTAYRLKYENASGWWSLLHANSANRRVMRFPGSAAAQAVYAPLFENGLSYGTTAALFRHSAGLPSTGVAHIQGEICWATTSSSGDPAGRFCTVSGTPGTWRTFGTISTSS